MEIVLELTLDIKHEQSVTQCEWRPELKRIRLGQEVFVNVGSGRQARHSEGQDHSSLQRGQEGVAGGPQGDAPSAVTLGGVQRVQTGHVTPQAVAGASQSPAERRGQEDVEGAVGRPLVEEGQGAGEAATQRKLALDEEQLQASGVSILCGDVRWMRCLKNTK